MIQTPFPEWLYVSFATFVIRTLASDTSHPFVGSARTDR